jgi:translation elongation factor P/translation initiation factor 5A
MAESSLLKNCTVVRGVAQSEITALLEPILASVQDLKNGKYCCSKNHGQPGTISAVKMSKTGKHGHAKFTFQLKYPLTGQTSQEMFPGHTHLTRPKVKKFEWQVTNYDEGGIYTCLDDKNEEVTLSITDDFAHNDHNVTGKELKQAWEDYNNGDLDGDIWLTVLEAPVKGKTEKEHILVRQVSEFKVKD